MTAGTATGTSPAVFGWAGFIVGAVAMMAALFIFWAGPFAPQQATGVSLGELAADITKSAMRSAAGLAQPDPVSVPRDIDDHLGIAVPMLSGLALILGLVGLIRREDLRPAVAAAVLGGGTIAFQVFTWMVLAIIGALIVMALLHSLSSVFDGIFGG